MCTVPPVAGSSLAPCSPPGPSPALPPQAARKTIEAAPTATNLFIGILILGPLAGRIEQVGDAPGVAPAPSWVALARPKVHCVTWVRCNMPHDSRVVKWLSCGMLHRTQVTQCTFGRARATHDGETC